MRKCTEQESPVAIGVVALLESFVHLLQQPLHLIQNAACNCQWVITAEGVLHSKLVKPADAVSASEMKHPLWAQPQGQELSHNLHRRPESCLASPADMLPDLALCTALHRLDGFGGGHARK
eukprot:scaffold65669_cov17-Tisochrysis_lutea.AAC.1